MDGDRPDSGDELKPLDSVQRAFARRVTNLSTAVRRVRHAEDAKAIHDLRVAARRLDAMLRTWDGLFPSRPRNAALRVLRKLRRRFGEARELEVHVAMLEPHVASHDNAVLRVLQKMRSELARRTGRAVSRLKPKRLKRTLRRLQDAASHFETESAQDSRLFDRARARAREAGAMARVAVELAGEQPDDWTLHQARIAIKKWRYTIECVDPLSADGRSNTVPLLRAIQDRLGIAQDRTTLIEAIERYGRKEDPAALQPILDELEAEKRAALDEFESLAASLHQGAEAMRASGRKPVAELHPARPSEPRVPRREPSERTSVAAASAAPERKEETDPQATERWTHMADWLLKESSGKN